MEISSRRSVVETKAATMIRKLALLCLMAPVFLDAARQVGFRYKFELSIFGFGTSNFIDGLRSNTSALAKGWVNVERPYSPDGYEALQLWCPADDYVICILTDETGYTAGLQISIPSNKFTPALDMAVLGFQNWSADVDGETIEYYTKAQYFVSADAATRIAYANPDKALIRNDYVAVEGFNGELVKIAASLSNLDSIFTKQACIPWMGLHYYYDMSSSLECSASTILTWFPLYENDALVGMGFLVPGTLTVASGEVDHFEHPKKSDVEMIVNSGPQCLYDIVGNSSVITLHSYFIETPRQLLCL
ncbi:unnamed protein product [Spodoptera littoralis]|uniref:Uncharacterized protein n=1 Tax=Spodoptera littoralis TaxID=7109 RepID=A0A9P0N029_SPOLI|nr:unnamed protein product [Spodoptera littoralis]CAH1637593.1 unnamed protein product [Spodoptera littoralis]